jgi:oxalate decarboxylase/phosphoglucose isomerase-like protein (cupin superfamily)
MNTIGTRLLSENDGVRVWEIRLEPGERVETHRHEHNYFWTAVTAGKARQRTKNETKDVVYQQGETKHFTFGPGEYLEHDLENIGAETLIFTTVEFS